MKILILKKFHQSIFCLLADKWKNKGLYPDEVILKKSNIREKFFKIYKIYQKLVDLNSTDFSDLILHTVKI